MASWLISSGGKEGGVQHCSLCPLLVTVTFPLLSSDICGAHVLTCLALIGEVTDIGGLHLFSSVSPLCNVPGSGISLSSQEEQEKNVFPTRTSFVIMKNYRHTQRKID